MKRFLLPFVLVAGCSTTTVEPTPTEPAPTVVDLTPKTFLYQNKVGMKVHYIVRCASSYYSVLNMGIELDGTEEQDLTSRISLFLRLAAYATRSTPQAVGMMFQTDYNFLQRNLKSFGTDEQIEYFDTAIPVCDSYYSNFVSVKKQPEFSI